MNRMALKESIKSTLFVYVLFCYYYNWEIRGHGITVIGDETGVAS